MLAASTLKPTVHLRSDGSDFFAASWGHDCHLGNKNMIRPVRAEDRASTIEVVCASGLFVPDELAEVEAMLDGHLTDGTWNLYLLAVHPDRQGQGRGSSLVRHVEQDLRTRGVRLLLIETSGLPEFGRQRAFYTRLGYRQEARIHDFYGSGDDKVIYSKSLAPTRPVIGC